MFWLRRALMLLVVAIVVAGTVYALLPKPVAADLATVDRGAIEVTIDEDGVARIRDVYKVSATVAGYLDRFPLEVGDPVKRNDTVVAEIRPSAPAFLDERTRRELEAAVGAATAAVRLAEAELAKAEADLRMHEADLDRSEQLRGSGTISARAMDEATGRGGFCTRRSAPSAGQSRGAAKRADERGGAAYPAERRRQIRHRHMLRPDTRAGRRRGAQDRRGKRAGRRRRDADR